MISLLLRVFDGFFSALNQFLWFAKTHASDEDVKNAAKAKVQVENRDKHVEVVERASKDPKSLEELRKMAAE